MKILARLALSLLAVAPVGATLAADDPVARGRYLAVIGGCNDCHTDGYAPSDGNLPEARWLLGSQVGFSGPWGVSYASNLRLLAAGLDAAGWKERARRGGLPPMPWPSLRAMSDEDLDALYRYLRHLGPAGEAVPAALAPGEPVRTPHFVFVPQPPQVVTAGAPAR